MARNENLRRKIELRLKNIEKRTLEEADVITFPSKAAKNYFENSMGKVLNEDKTRIIYNGIDLELIQNIEQDLMILSKYKIEKNDKTLLLFNIAAHTKAKNIDILLNAIALLKNKYKKEVLLVNAGVGDLTDELKGLSKKLQIDKNVKFLGKIPNEDILSLLKVISIFIMTSEKVIFDLVVLEALASGACAVVSNEGGNCEIIRDGVNGFLIEIDDPESIAHKLITINPDSVKENAKKTASRFSVNKMINDYFELYDSLL